MAEADGAALRQRLAPAAGGAPLCKLFMLGKLHDASCQVYSTRARLQHSHARMRPSSSADAVCAQRTHASLEERPGCTQYARAGRCPRGAGCFFPHALPKPAAAADAPCLVLQAPRSRLARVAAAAEAALGAAVDVSAAVRADDARGCDFALFVRPCGDDVPAAAAALAAQPDLAGSLTRALWVHRRDDSAEAAAAGAAAALAALSTAHADAQASDAVQLRIFPPWAAPALREALAAAGVRCDGGAPGGGAPPLVLDAALAAGRWHWHAWRTSAAPPLLALRGRAAYAPPPAGDAAAAVPSRALFKLDEALRAGALPLRAGALCADVGAAPGGWSARLSDQLLSLEAAASDAPSSDKSAPIEPGHVWAIDPAELTLSPLPANVTHLKLRGEAAAAPLSEALRGRRLDWVCCDANTHPGSAAALVLLLAPLMAADAGVLLSLKRFAQSRAEHEADVAAAAALLAAAGFAQTAALHLFANGANERTAVWRRGGAVNGAQAEAPARAEIAAVLE
jgi:23S rRNA U2552 (ribose-2'-O)-methylase RlmE/FtsJ